MSRKLLQQIVTRLCANALTLFIVSVVTFLLMNAKAPEDIARSVLGREISREQIAKFVQRNGLDRSIEARYFAQRAASRLGLTGYARNLDDGSVEVYAAGAPEKLSDFAARLRQGPRWADVRGVEEQEAAVQQYGSFEIE